MDGEAVVIEDGRTNFSELQAVLSIEYFASDFASTATTWARSPLGPPNWASSGFFERVLSNLCSEKKIVHCIFRLGLVIKNRMIDLVQCSNST